jgi:cell division protein FtsI/penicillin-binding protein 2
MIKAQQLRRLCLLAGLLLLAFAGLGYRLVDLQVLRHDVLRQRADANTHRAYLYEPRRGEIRDIRGNPLATSMPARTVCADPSLIGNRQVEITRAIAPLLQMNEARIYELLSRKWRTNEAGQVLTNRYVVLKRKVPVETWNQVHQVMTNLTFGLDESKLGALDARFIRELRESAVFADPVSDQLRIYPNQRLAAHVLGYVGMHAADINGRNLLETVGMDGVELVFNRQLSGVRGWRVTEKDKRNHELVFLREQDVEPADGLNVVLTIDAGVQYIVEAALADAVRDHRPESVTCVVMRPRTGEILAMATMPNFDPNLPGDAPEAARRNRVVTDQYEPGSTFKITVVSGALNDNLVRPSDPVFCENGRFSFAGHVLHDAHPHGTLSVEGVITKSSNIGAAKIGIKLGPERLYEYLRNFGFGAVTGLGLPGEVKGELHPTKDWSKVSIVQIPMGHGVAVTRLQILYAMGAIANHGLLMRPQVVSRLEDQEGRVVAKYDPQPVRQVITPEAAALMVRALKTVVTKDGTAYKARLEHYTVAGKTGTAQKPVPGGYSSDKYIASFLGFFPADNPELCIGVVMDDPKGGHFGGEVCGPVFQQMAEKAANYLNIHPDIEEDEKEREGGKLARKNGGVLAASGAGRTTVN